MKNKQEKNPFFTKKGAWLWVLCAPAALVGSAIAESKKEIKKKRKKQAKKDAEFRREHWEYDCWQDNGGL